MWKTFLVEVYRVTQPQHNLKVTQKSRDSHENGFPHQHQHHPNQTQLSSQGASMLFIQQHQHKGQQQEKNNININNDNKSTTRATIKQKNLKTMGL